MLYSQEPWLREHKLEAHLTNPDTQDRNGLSIYSQSKQDNTTNPHKSRGCFNCAENYHTISQCKYAQKLPCFTLRTPTNYM